MRININSFVIIVIFFVFPYISLAEITNKKEELQINEHLIKQLMQEYINVENSEKMEEIKKELFELKAILINLRNY